MAEPQPESQSPLKDPKSPEKEPKADPEHPHKSDSDSDDEHQHHDHDHDHDHDHGHDHGHDHAGHDHENKGDGKKSSRGEKKFKKAMTKLGMKPVSGINRVTIKKAKSLLLYIDDPEILKNPGSDNSYIIFGEAKILDFPGNLANEEASKFKKPEKPEDLEKNKQAAEQKPSEEPKPEVQVEEGEVNEEGLEQDTIKMVMEHCGCSRAAAVKALRKSNGDSVNAIIALTGTG